MLMFATSYMVGGSVYVTFLVVYSTDLAILEEWQFAYRYEVGAEDPINKRTAVWYYAKFLDSCFVQLH